MTCLAVGYKQISAERVGEGLLGNPLISRWKGIGRGHDPSSFLPLLPSLNMDMMVDAIAPILQPI